jgi:hypothetical protein
MAPDGSTSAAVAMPVSRALILRFIVPFIVIFPLDPGPGAARIPARRVPLVPGVQFASRISS